LQDVFHGHDSHEFSFIDYGEPPNLAMVHKFGRIINGGTWADACYRL
jgi:hypothetical protein